MQFTSATSDNLAYLRASPAKLLVLACVMYLRSKPRSYVNYMAGGFAIFQAWCKDHPSWSRSSELHSLPKPNFNVTQLVPGYEINRIAMFLNLPNHVIESALASAIRMIACPKI